MRITGGEGIDVAFDALGPKSFRKDYRLLRAGGRLVMYGYSESESAGGRNLAAFAGTLVRAPFATYPWWKSLAVMNENKGVFGLNMLSWWNREGLDRVLGPLADELEAGHYDPVVAESFPSTAPPTRTASSPSARTSARSCSRPERLNRHVRFFRPDDPPARQPRASPSPPPPGGIALGGAIAARETGHRIRREGGRAMSPEQRNHVPDVADADRVHIFDTTLRDGEQSPGISLNTQEKVEIAQQLARLGVDVIEAGFPITSPGDFEAVEAIARKVEGPVICGLARTHKADIDAAWNAIKDAERPRIHTFISTSDIHIEHQLQTDREDVKGQAKAAVALARSYCDDVEFSPMDATRADVEFTAEVCAIAVAEGANVINIPDTVGYTTPGGVHGATCAGSTSWSRGCADVRLSVHCHDDLGLAVANSYAGVLAGARQVECAVNGIGERAGNCSLEEIVMLLRTRRDEHGLDTGRRRARAGADQPHGLAPHRLRRAAEQGDRRPQRVRARVRHPPGRRAQGAHDLRDHGPDRTSGSSRTRSCSASTPAATRCSDALEQLGFKVEGNALNQAFKRFKEIADKKKQVTALDLEAIVSDEMRERTDSYDARLVRGRGRDAPRALGAGGGPDARPARRSIGESRAATGRSTRSSARSATPSRPSASSASYTVSAVTEGEDALGEVTVMLRAHGRLASGQGVATDILEASARAYVRALSNALDGAAVREAEGLTAEAAGEPLTPGP